MNRFIRLEKIIGEDNLNILKDKTVLVLGCGGVGGYVCEALARSAVGSLIIIDYDVVEESNINRQIIALKSTIGKKKVDVLEARIKEINETCEVIKIDKFINCSNLEDLFNYEIDYFVDACDTVSVKKGVIDECLLRKIKFISCMGTGNKFHPEKLSIVDIRKTVNDPLARVIRKYVKDKKIKDRVTVLSSDEVPVKTEESVVGSCSFVPSVAGLLIAGYVIREFIKKK